MTTSPAPDRRPLVTAALVAVVLVLGNLAFWLLPGLFEPLRDQTSDRLFSLRWRFESLRPDYDDTVVHVAIDDASLRQREGFYLGRAEHARLIRNLDRAGIAAQLHDVIFVAPLEPEADRELIEATASAGKVYFGASLGLSIAGSGPAEAEPDPSLQSLLEDNRWNPARVDSAGALPASRRRLLTFPGLAHAARGVGFLDTLSDRDGVYRRLHLLARDGESFFPSMALRVLADYLDVPPERITVEPGSRIVLGEARRPDREGQRDIAIPIDRQGRMIVNWAGPWGTMLQYPFGVIYEASDDRFMMEDLRDELAGKIAVVSWVATGSGDTGTVPGDAFYPLSGIHANAMNTILTGDFLRRASLWQMLFWIELPLMLLLFGAALRLSTVQFVFLPPLLALGYAALAALAFFHRGWLLDIPGPLMILAGATLLVAAYRYHRESTARAVLRSTFDAYFPANVVDKVMGHGHGLIETAQKKELTILFSDIRGFTSHTANMEAGRVRELLNEYFERMIEIVFEHQGTLDKFIGDGLMVFFGDPEPQPDHAERCVRAAVEMQRAAREIRDKWRQRGEMPLEIRIGVNTGDVIVGNMGSSKRLSYTVLGEPVNLAQRLESNAAPGGILISARTHQLLGGAILTRALGPIRVKGIEAPIEVYEVTI